MRLARWRYAPLYDGFYYHASRLYHNQCSAVCSRRCIICIRSWRDQQGRSQKDKLGIIFRATPNAALPFLNSTLLAVCVVQIKPKKC